MDKSGTRRVTVEEAAQLPGIKEESVRKRVSRGKLRTDKDAEGRLLVYLAVHRQSVTSTQTSPWLTVTCSTSRCSPASPI